MEMKTNSSLQLESSVVDGLIGDFNNIAHKDTIRKLSRKQSAEHDNEPPIQGRDKSYEQLYSRFLMHG